MNQSDNTNNNKVKVNIPLCCLETNIKIHQVRFFQCLGFCIVLSVLLFLGWQLLPYIKLESDATLEESFKFEQEKTGIFFLFLGVNICFFFGFIGNLVDWLLLLLYQRNQKVKEDTIEKVID